MVCLPLAQFYHHYEVKMKLAALNLGVGKVPYLPLGRAAKNWREMKSSLQVTKVTKLSEEKAVKQASEIISEVKI